jgi:hypothetical protein
MNPIYIYASKQEEDEQAIINGPFLNNLGCPQRSTWISLNKNYQ